MGIWSLKDIKESGIKIKPKPMIKDISIDLGLEKLFSIDNFDMVHEIMGKPFDSLDPIGGKKSGVLDLLKLREIKPVDGRWYLNRCVPVVAKYRERFTGNMHTVDRMQVDVTQRSTYARCGIGGFAYDIKDGYFWELLVPVLNNVIYPGDRISQVTLMDEDTTTLGQDKVRELLEMKEVAIFNDINPRRALVNILYEGCILLSLNKNIYAFNGNWVDRKKFKKDDFIPLNLMKTIVRKQNFLLGRSNETVSLSSKYAAKLTKVDPVHFSTINYAPYIKPTTCGFVITEMFHSEDKGIHPDLTIPMYLIEVKTPCPQYAGNYNRQRNVILPFL